MTGLKPSERDLEMAREVLVNFSGETIIPVPIGTHAAVVNAVAHIIASARVEERAICVGIERARCQQKARETGAYYAEDIFRPITKEEKDWLHQERPELGDFIARACAAIGRLVAKNIAEAIERNE